MEPGNRRTHPPSLTSVEVHPFDAKEAQLFLAAASGDRFRARWLIAVLLGLRQGEVLGLAWRDVDLDHRVPAVRQTLQYRPGEGFHLVPPKKRDRAGSFRSRMQWSRP